MISIVLCCFALSPVRAQQIRSDGVIGVGAQAGTPTGLTLKYYPRQDIGIVLLGSWSLERFLLFSIHFTYEYPIPDSPLRFFFGPGLGIGRKGDNNNSDLNIDISVMPGLNFFTEKFEVFLQGLPGIQIAPDSKLTLGGAVGLRYFF